MDMHIKYDLVLKKELGLGFNKKFIQLQANAIGYLNKHVTSEGICVLDYMLKHMAFNNAIGVKNKDIQVDVGLSRQNAHRGIKALLSTFVIYSARKVLGIDCYLLNPEIGWYGSEYIKLKLLTLLDNIDFDSGYIKAGSVGYIPRLDRFRLVKHGSECMWVDSVSGEECSLDRAVMLAITGRCLKDKHDKVDSNNNNVILPIEGVL